MALRDYDGYVGNNAGLGFYLGGARSFFVGRMGGGVCEECREVEGRLVFRSFFVIFSFLKSVWGLLNVFFLRFEVGILI